MLSISKRSKEVAEFILETIKIDHRNVVRITSKKYGISRQAVHVHLKRLINDGLISSYGITNQKIYHLNKSRFTFKYEIDECNPEIVVKDLKINKIPDDAKEILNLCIYEIINNAKEHSGCKNIKVTIKRSIFNTEIAISDDGIGIFKNIQNNMINWKSERSILFQIIKGGFTTKPIKHSGIGLFTCMHLLDELCIKSGTIDFSIKKTKIGKKIEGTFIKMRINNYTHKVSSKIISNFINKGKIIKTVVPIIQLQNIHDEKLISRSQAKYLMNRLNMVKTVVLDFKLVTMIGNSFADEIFRVFHSNNKHVSLLPINMNENVRKAVLRAKLGL
ncbi:MAG TPA: DUF4325 domain-containing protein [Ignavibacteria bacterium]|mgnify:CR=1 FL=1|nr:DUF4325 domain-containing protein [Ignavibacteria bacterium]